MRIVELNPFHYPYMGGIEHRIHHVSKELAKRHEVIVLTSRLEGTEEEEMIDGYRVVRLDSRYMGSYNPPYVTTPGIDEALSSLDPDVLDTHYRWAPSYTRAARDHVGAKVHTYHNTYGEGVGLMGLASRLNDWRFMRELRSYDRVVAVSEFVRRDLVSRGVPEAEVDAIPNGVDVPGTVSTEDEDFLLFVGRIVRTKGLDRLIRAMPEIRSDLVICGDGPDLERLRTLASKVGVDGRVDFRGRVPEEEKWDLMDRCRVFVFPSVFESYGIAAAEAMAHGRPVAASNVGGIPEVVRDGGVLFDPDDRNSIVRAVNSLLDDPQARASAAVTARRLAESYGWVDIAARVEDVYSSVISSSRSRRASR